MELFTKATKELMEQQLININSLLILNVDAYLCEGYCSYKENIEEQIEGIEKIFAGASIDYSVAPNLHNKVQALKDILDLQDEQDNEKEVIELTLDYLEDRVTNKLVKPETKLSLNDYSVLELAIGAHLIVNRLDEEKYDDILGRIEDLGANIGIHKALTEKGVDKVNTYVKDAMKHPNADMEELYNIIKENKTTADIFEVQELIEQTSKLANEV